MKSREDDHFSYIDRFLLHGAAQAQNHYILHEFTFYTHTLLIYEYLIILKSREDDHLSYSDRFLLHGAAQAQNRYDTLLWTFSMSRFHFSFLQHTPLIYSLSNRAHVNTLFNRTRGTYHIFNFLLANRVGLHLFGGPRNPCSSGRASSFLRDSLANTRRKVTKIRIVLENSC